MEGEDRNMRPPRNLQVFIAKCRNKITPTMSVNLMDLLVL